MIGPRRVSKAKRRPGLASVTTVVVGHQRSTVNEKALKADFAHVWRWESGRIAEAWLFGDSAAVAAALRSGQKRMAEEACESVAATRPADAVVAVTYAQVLASDEQRAEALAVLDKASAAVKSASELYFIASQYTAAPGSTANRPVKR